jgi:uncharacterized protein YxeA
MKNIINSLLAAVFALSLIACQESDYYDDTPPDPPKNLFVKAGDSKTEISWDRNRESDVSGYNIYYSDSYDGKYELIGSSETNYYVDRDAVNGEKYFYAVTAYDFSGNESELSYDYAYGVARPEGFNQIVFDYLNFPETAGYSFAKNKIVPFDGIDADFFFENYNGEYFLNVWYDSDIQDLGYTNSIYDISMAPSDGWVPMKEGENVKYVNAIVGHTYVIWTLDNHFAKIRISQITEQRIVFDWAYQLLEGERQLKRVYQERPANLSVQKK